MDIDSRVLRGAVDRAFDEDLGRKALIAAFDIVEDADLERMRETIRSTIMGYDPATLRKNPEMRAQAATEAQQIMADMAGFMTAFGGA